MGVPPAMVTFVDTGCLAGEDVRGVEVGDGVELFAFRPGEPVRVCTLGMDGSSKPENASARCDVFAAGDAERGPCLEGLPPGVPSWLLGLFVAGM